MITIYKKKYLSTHNDGGAELSEEVGNPEASASADVSAVVSDTCDGIELPETQEPKEESLAGSFSEKIPDPHWTSLIENTSSMALRKQYKQAANSHKNMLQRQKTHGAIVAPEFINFKSFLLHMGPPPAKNATLDRIDPTDHEYAPGKVRWADKATQANNKTNTLLFHCSKTGGEFTASQLAKTQGVVLSTIHKRRSSGWTDDEVIAGKRFTHSDVALWASGGLPSEPPLPSSVPGELATEAPVSFKDWENIYIKFKDRIDIEFVELVQEQLFSRFPEVRKAYYSTFAPAVGFSGSPQKRWVQLHHVFPVTRRIAEQVSDRLAWDVCPELRPEISARRQSRRVLLQGWVKAEKETAAKDQEWAEMCLAGEIDQGAIPGECYVHLAGIRAHILDAYRLYVSPEHEGDAEGMSFAEFILGLTNDDN